MDIMTAAVKRPKKMLSEEVRKRKKRDWTRVNIMAFTRWRDLKEMKGCEAASGQTCKQINSSHARKFGQSVNLRTNQP